MSGSGFAVSEPLSTPKGRRGLARPGRSPFEAVISGQGHVAVCARYLAECGRQSLEGLGPAGEAGGGVGQRGRGVFEYPALVVEISAEAVGPPAPPDIRAVVGAHLGQHLG